MKILFTLFILILITSCSTPKTVLVCGDHVCVNKAEAEQYFEDNLTIEVKIVEKKNKEEIDLVRLNLKEDSNGRFFLSLRLPFNRSWASLERALERSLFEITDRNRSEGAYYVTYIGPRNENEGWFDWLWGEEEGHPLAGKKFFLNVITKSESEVSISIVEAEEDSTFDRRQEQTLLSLLKGNIT